MGSADAFNDGAREQLKVGAGPFLVQKRDAEAGHVVLVRNPKWWGEPAKLKKIVLESLPGDKRAAALADGSVDVAAVDQVAAKRVASARRAASHKKAGDGNAAPQGDKTGPVPGRTPRPSPRRTPFCATTPSARRWSPPTPSSPSTAAAGRWPTTGCAARWPAPSTARRSPTPSSSRSTCRPARSAAIC